MFLNSSGKCVLVLIRVDAHNAIGSGHFFRCLALSNRIARQSHELITFMGHIVAEDLRDRVIEAGFNFQEIPLGTSQEIELEFVMKSLNNEKSKVIIIDSSEVDVNYQQKLRKKGFKIIVIDDRPLKRHVADILISPNLYLNNSHPFANLTPETTRIFIGPSYFPLRQEFLGEKNWIPPKLEDQIVITSFFGSADPGGQSLIVAEAAREMRSLPIKFRVLAGAMNSSLSLLQKKYSSLQTLQIFSSQRKMSDFFLSSTLSIGSMGISAWERCILGIPTISTTQNAGQIEDALELEKLGGTIYLGKSDSLRVNKLLTAIDSLMKNTNRLELLSKNSLRVMANYESDTRVLIENILA